MISGFTVGAFVAAAERARALKPQAPSEFLSKHAHASSLRVSSGNKLNQGLGFRV